MEIGDDAILGGMTVVNGAAANSAPQIDDYINRAMDYIANGHTYWKTGVATPVDHGGTGATSAAGARSNLGVTPHNIGAWRNSGAGNGDLGFNGARLQYEVPGYAFVTTVANYSDVGGPSSAQFKEDIQSWSPDKQAILAMRLVQFHYKTSVSDDQSIQFGLIAEELHELGLEWLVEYDESGAPFSVRYYRIALALLPVIQDHEARIAALEAGA